MGKFITVSLHFKSRFVFQGEISWSDFQGLRNIGSLGRAGLGAASVGILGTWGDCKVALGMGWEGFPVCFLVVEGREAKGVDIAGNPADPTPRRPLLRVRRAAFAAFVGSDERGEGALFAGVVLWREED